MALSGSETPGNGANVCLIDRVTLFYCFKKKYRSIEKKIVEIWSIKNFLWKNIFGRFSLRNLLRVLKSEASGFYFSSLNKYTNISAPTSDLDWHVEQSLTMMTHLLTIRVPERFSSDDTASNAVKASACSFDAAIIIKYLSEKYFAFSQKHNASLLIIMCPERKEQSPALYWVVYIILLEMIALE